MRYMLFFAGLFITVSAVAQNNGKDTVKQPTPRFQYVEQMPKAGYDFNDYLRTNLHYPLKAKMAGITGRVVVRFIVTETGAIDSVTVLRGIGAGCDEEAARVIKKMPPWIPAKQQGKPVRVYFTQPIVFNF